MRTEIGFSQTENFWSRHPRLKKAGQWAGGIAIAGVVTTGTTLAVTAESTPKCGVGVAEANTGTPWQVAEAAAADAEVANPDITSTTDKLPNPVHAGYAWRICFEGGYPTSVEPTTNPNLLPPESPAAIPQN